MGRKQGLKKEIRKELVKACGSDMINQINNFTLIGVKINKC